jgi:hypothetical protein
MLKEAITATKAGAARRLPPERNGMTGDYEHIETRNTP